MCEFQAGIHFGANLWPVAIANASMANQPDRTFLNSDEPRWHQPTLPVLLHGRLIA
jgi:hypothetical protein